MKLVTERGFTIDDPDLSDFGRTIIHTRAGGFGADWDVSAAVAFIDAAEQVGWGDSLLGHNLYAVKDGRCIFFDVKGPAHATNPIPEPTPNRRIASHPDDPDAPLADRLLLALGMWPDYVDQLGVDAVLDGTVMLRSDAHRYPMVCEDYGAVAADRDRLQEALEHIRDLTVSDAHLALTIAWEALDA